MAPVASTGACGRPRAAVGAAAPFMLVVAMPAGGAPGNVGNCGASTRAPATGTATPGVAGGRIVVGAGVSIAPTAGRCAPAPATGTVPSPTATAGADPTTAPATGVVAGATAGVTGPDIAASAAPAAGIFAAGMALAEVAGPVPVPALGTGARGVPRASSWISSGVAGATATLAVGAAAFATATAGALAGAAGVRGVTGPTAGGEATVVARLPPTDLSVAPTGGAVCCEVCGDAGADFPACAGLVGAATVGVGTGVTCKMGCPLFDVPIDRVTVIPAGSGALSRTASTISPICSCVSPPANVPSTCAGTGCPAACTSPTAARASCASATSVAGAAGTIICGKDAWIGMAAILADPG